MPPLFFTLFGAAYAGLLVFLFGLPLWFILVGAVAGIVWDLEDKL